jgi:hypothetical protein
MKGVDTKKDKKLPNAKLNQSDLGETYPIHRQKLMREFAFSRSWAGTYIPPSIMRQVAIHPLLNPNNPRMRKNVRSLNRGNQGPRFETLQAQKRGQKSNREMTRVTRMRGLWIVRYRGESPGVARPRRSAALNSRKWIATNIVG